MATKNTYVMCEIDEITHEPIYNFFAKLSNAFDWKAVLGDNNDKHFVLNDNVEIVCKDFEKTRTHILITTVTARIIAVVNGQEIELYSSIDTLFHPESRYFCLTSSEDGGIVVQLGTNNVENDDPDNHDFRLSSSGVCVIFAILACKNYVKNDNRIRYGLYIPKTRGSISSSGSSYTYTAFDPTPRYWATEDTKAVSTSSLQFVNSGGSTLVIAPVTMPFSECITTEAKVEVVGTARVGRGYSKVGGMRFYSIGGLFIK